MKELKEHANSLELNTEEMPDEYIIRADKLIKAREQAEIDLRAALPSVTGIDDRLNGELHRLDIQLRKDLALLRKEYGIES